MAEGPAKMAALALIQMMLYCRLVDRIILDQFISKAHHGLWVPFHEVKELSPVLLLPFQFFQVRAHMYQARSLIGSDASGLSDPFARVIIGEWCKITQVSRKTVFELKSLEKR